jgi:hypothetical protein
LIGLLSENEFATLFQQLA